MVCTSKEERIMREYKESVDADVLEFVSRVINGEERESYITVAFFSVEAAAEVEKLTGKMVYGCRIVLDVNAVHHIMNRHGPAGRQDQSMKNIEDIARMRYVIMNYDKISYNNISTTGYLDETGKPAPMIQISKRIDGSYYVIGAVNSSKRKKNYIVTAYMSQEKEQ